MKIKGFAATRTVASSKSKTPPAQNVQSYDGGEMVKRMQQGGGSGVAGSLVISSTTTNQKP